jgi:hypothetical protein
MSIVDYSVFNPSIDTLFFDPTAADDYWSSTTFAASPSDAWVVNFFSGNVFLPAKSFPFRVRAV